MENDAYDAIYGDLDTIEALSKALTGLMTRVGELERRLNSRLDRLENDIARCKYESRK